MDSIIEAKVESCQQCKMFTNKTTREPLRPHAAPAEAWRDVSVDLFGPMPDRQHILAVIDKSSRFPAAKIVPNTSNSAVTTALSGIYADYGQPDSHQTDNGPPFNSEGFAEFSQEHGIQHRKTYPYHPQGNPVENFMRPLGKAMKAAHNQKGDKKRALDDMLASYRATPHPSTGISPGNMMFRYGYKKDFPRTTTDDEAIKAAINADREAREVRGREINASNHRVPTKVRPKQLVYTRNTSRNKFDPIFGPELHEVIDVSGNGVTLLRPSDNRIMRRHLDDVKDATAVAAEEETCWIGDTPAPNPVQVPPMPATPPVVGPNTRPQRERRPPAYYRDDCWLMG